MSERPCAFCGKKLDSALPDDVDDSRGGFQPSGGGEIRLTFCYGSCQFDCTPGLTRALGFICDDCAAKAAKHMSWSATDFNGEPVELTIGDDGIPEPWSPSHEEVQAVWDKYKKRQFGSGKDGC